MWLDIRFALRRLLRSPGVALAGVVTLALGIGIAASVFSVVEGTLLRPLPYQDPEQLVMVWNRQKLQADASNLISGGDYFDLSQRLRGVSAMGWMGEVVIAPISGAGEPDYAAQAPTSCTLHKTLGIEPLLGRLLTPEDCLPLPSGSTAPPPPTAVVISHGFWQRAFGGDPGVLGRVIRTFHFSSIVVGVLPPDFRLILPSEASVGDDLGAGIDIWRAARWDLSQAGRESRTLRVIARLQEDAGLADLKGELEAQAMQLRREHSHHQLAGLALDAAPLVEEASSHIRPLLMLLSGAVGFVLLIACANVAGLLLTRSSARRREMAVRSALGAGALRIACLSLAESLLLAFFGAGGGVALSLLGMKILQLLRPAGLPQASDLRLNLPVLGFALAACVLSALLAGSAPAFKAVRQGRGSALGARSSSASRSQRRTQELLAAAQVGLTLVLLTGAGLMLRSFVELQKVPLGFDPEPILTADISTISRPPAQWDQDGFRQWAVDRRGLERQLADKLSALPGVRAAAGVFPVPLNGVYARTADYSLQAEGRPELSGVAYFRNVWPGYFDSMGIALLAGQDFRWSDDRHLWEENRPTVIVDRQLAQRLWPDQDPIGRRLTYRIFGAQPTEAEVIGLAPYVPQGGLRDQISTLYIPRGYYRSMEFTVTVRCTGDLAALRPAVKRAIQEVFPLSPVSFKDMSEYVAQAQASTRFVLVLLGVFAGLALVLACVGLYGTLALMVHQRTVEIGVRIAMGARPAGILGMVLSRALALTAGGALAGLAGSLLLTRYLGGHLYGVTATDPLTLAAAALLLLGVGLASCWRPARSASIVDPMSALRTE